jgi:hypothetical protein
MAEKMLASQEFFVKVGKQPSIASDGSPTLSSFMQQLLTIDFSLQKDSPCVSSKPASHVRCSFL